MKVVSLNNAPSIAEALAIIDALRKDVEEGKVAAFLVSAVTPEDDTISYVGCTRKVSQLRIMGALSQSLFDIQNGELEP